MSNDKKDSKAKEDDEEKKKKKHKKNKSDDKLKEFYIKDKFGNVSDSLKLFQDDPLLSKPGMNQIVECQLRINTYPSLLYNKYV